MSLDVPAVIDVIVGIGSVKGSPGATTLGLGIASVWPGTAALLVEADPSGGDVGLWYRTGEDRGLASLAEAARRTAHAGAVQVLDHAHDLGNGLYAVPGPVDADDAGIAVESLVGRRGLLRAAVHEGEVGVVVLDLGRLDASSPAQSLLGELDALLVVSRGDAGDLAHLATRGPALAGLRPWPRHVGVMLTQGCRYRIREVEEAVGLPLYASVPSDETSAMTLTGAPPNPRLGRGGYRFGTRPLMRALTDLAGRLSKVAPPRATRRPPIPLAPAVPAAALTARGPGPAPSAAEAGWTMPARTPASDHPGAGH